MRTQLGGVSAQVSAVVVLVVRGRGVEIGVEGDLGVDDELLVAGQVHHQVGAQPPVLELDLLGEVALVDQAGQLDRAAQVHLPPAPPDLRFAQRRRQRPGLGLQPPDLGLELSLPAGALAVEVLHLVAEPVEPLHHLGLVHHPGRDRLHAPRPHPQHAEQSTQDKTDHQPEHEDPDLHTCDPPRDHRQFAADRGCMRTWLTTPSLPHVSET